MSDWTNSIKFVNSYPICKGFFRPMEVRNHVDGSKDTITLYVNYLHKAGYLKRIGRGMYQRFRPIPPNLTLAKLRSFAYPDGKNWEERKQIVERYWKVNDIIEKTK